MSVSILVGHVIDKLRDLPDESVHCAVTSPPYWGLRDYGIEPQVWGGHALCSHVWGDWTENRREDTTSGKSRTSERFYGGDETRKFNGNHQKIAAGAFCAICGAWRGSLGLEPDYRLYIEHMVEVFRDVRRVLRPDGVLFLNLGDSYCSTDKWGGGGNGNNGKHTLAPDGSVPSWAVRERKQDQPGLKPKDLCGIPWRVAFALQSDGWWLRQDIIWSKPNPMPESVTDRCTKAHEYLFLLSKSERYWFDAAAIAESVTPGLRVGGSGQSWHDHQDDLVRGDRKTAPGSNGQHQAFENGRNKRSVWEVATQPFSEAHFATFPPDLIEPCIKAGTSEKGVCAECGAPWKREVDKQFQPQGSKARGVRGAEGQKPMDASNHWEGVPRGTTLTATAGWSPSCSCDAKIIPATVCDPFFGAGTSGLVADRLGRDCIGIELNETYADMARRRITDDAPLLAAVS